jgi:hypothetical protein
MADSTAFAFACDELENRTSLDRLETRGTVRIALKEAGLDAGSVTAQQMGVVMAQVMPGQLQSRGVDGADDVCTAIKNGLASLPEEAASESPDAVFARLGGTA